MATIDEVLKEIETQSQQQFLPIIGPIKGKVLEQVVKEQKPKRILEIGTLVGYSSILMSKHLPEDSSIITIDVNPEIAKIADSNFHKAGVNEKIEIIVGSGKQIIPSLTGPFNLLFLDAEKVEYLDYLKLAEDKLSPNAVVVADNVKIFRDELEGYLSYVRTSGKYQSQTFDFEQDAVEVSRLIQLTENFII